MNKLLLILMLFAMGCGEAAPLSKVTIEAENPFADHHDNPTSYPSPYPSPYSSPAPTPSPSPTTATSFFTKCVALSACKKLSTVYAPGSCTLYRKKPKTYTTEAQLDKLLKRCKK